MARAAVAGVRVEATSSSAYQPVGLPTPADDPLRLGSIGGWQEARARFTDRLAAQNRRLVILAREMSRRVEVHARGPTGIRLGDQLTAFHGMDAARLAAAAAGLPPRESLDEFHAVFQSRLAEPPTGIGVAEAARRRELGQLLRRIDDTRMDADREAGVALEEFRQEASAALAGGTTGGFLRRGRGRIAEALLAALFGALLVEALRSRPRVPPLVSRTTAGVGGVLLVLLLEGTPLLPVDPLRGLSVVFVPAALAAGLLTSPLLERLAGGSRPVSPRPRPTVSAVPPHPEEDTSCPGEPRAPFFPRRR